VIDGWIPQELGSRPSDMAGFRHVLVHGYTDVEPAIVADAVANHLGDLDDFVAAIRGRLDASTGRLQLRPRQDRL